MTDHEFPVIFRDDVQFKSLVNTWNYVDHWDNFNCVYEGRHAVPERLHGFTIIACDDPAEPYGALLQVAPDQAKIDGVKQLTGRKLLAKVRLAQNLS